MNNESWITTKKINGCHGTQPWPEANEQGIPECALRQAVSCDMETAQRQLPSTLASGQLLLVPVTRNSELHIFRQAPISLVTYQNHQAGCSGHHPLFSQPMSEYCMSRNLFSPFQPMTARMSPINHNLVAGTTPNSQRISGAISCVKLEAWRLAFSRNRSEIQHLHHWDEDLEKTVWHICLHDDAPPVVSWFELNPIDIYWHLFAISTTKPCTVKNKPTELTLWGSTSKSPNASQV